MSNSQEEALQEVELEIEELACQLADMLGAALYFAGVKEDNMQKAVDAYLNGIDEIFDDEEGVMGFEEVVQVIKHLQKTRKDLFS